MRDEYAGYQSKFHFKFSYLAQLRPYCVAELGMFVKWAIGHEQPCLLARSVSERGAAKLSPVTALN